MKTKSILFILKTLLFIMGLVEFILFIMAIVREDWIDAIFAFLMSIIVFIYLYFSIFKNKRRFK